ncbi:WD40 repeat-like protein [Westerdykella ornata]|uniref:WD40 repeat-like protein n=1 Tax=Westerdykella ornata TaxID=318751 RepID=A0A6A6JLA8_WESOR|nr:WD40 repeat-like protein [Westerdykella ornata]KAF2277292.1 WD40 repeat-like protein [Westerdykella ornata]
MRLASASSDRTVKICDASSGECLQTLKSHNSDVRSVAFSHDSAQIASASADCTVKIWDASSGKCLQTLKRHCDSVRSVSSALDDLRNLELGCCGLSPDRAWITYNSENVLWLPSEYRPSCSALSGKTIGVGVGSGKVWVCNFRLSES